MAEIVEGAVELRQHADGRIEILRAPPVTRISLELLQQSNPAVFAIRGREITMAGQVTYRVTGWDPGQSCLVADRIGGEPR